MAGADPLPVEELEGEDDGNVPGEEREEGAAADVPEHLAEVGALGNDHPVVLEGVSAPLRSRSASAPLTGWKVRLPSSAMLTSPEPIW